MALFNFNKIKKEEDYIEFGSTKAKINHPSVEEYFDFFSDTEKNEKEIETDVIAYYQKIFNKFIPDLVPEMINMTQYDLIQIGGVLLEIITGDYKKKIVAEEIREN